MNISHINNKLKSLEEREKTIRSIVNKKKISYNCTEWFSDDNKVKILNDGIKFSCNDQHRYISYLEKNNDFNLKPKNSLLGKNKIFNKFKISFIGSNTGRNDIRLFIIIYKENRKDVKSINLNSDIEIDLSNIEDIRLGIKFQGEGELILDSIDIEPIYKKNSSFPFVKNSNRRINNAKNIKEIKVAIIADEFTYESFKYEFDTIYLDPEDWLETLEQNKPDIFICESAWSGIDPDNRAWKGRIYGSVNFEKENRNELLDILSYCNNNNIITIFWNKEDPTHYNDKVHNFVDTAIKFDYIFTTSAECVEKYKKEYNHNNVYPLMFAVQPKIFNPIEKFNRSDEIIFAGSYYKQHKDRSKIMNKIFDEIIGKQYQLVIYDRHFYSDDENHVFPEKYKSFIRPRLDYRKIDKAYKESKYALNINTVTDSETMFARRVFELIASNTIVISNYSDGIKKYFGDLVIYIDENNHLKDLSKINYKKHRLKVLRNVLKYHTYEERFKYILDKIGYKYLNNEKVLSIISFVSNEQEILKSIEIVEKQTYQQKKLLLILDSENRVEDARLVQKYNYGQINVISRDYLDAYGETLEEIIETEYFTIINFEYFYGHNYFLDLMLSYKYLNETDIVTKNIKKPSYMFINDSSVYTSIYPKKVLQDIEINSFKKEASLQKLFSLGYRMFNTDRYNILEPEEINPTNVLDVNM